jgi:hypothetical protein
MPQTFPPVPRWYTASAGRTADVSLSEQSTLQSHVALCRLRQGGLSRLGSGVLSMQGLVATRFATVAMVLGTLVSGWLWLS